MHKVTRREFLRSSAMVAVGLAAASCAQPTPQVIEKPVTVVVEKQVPVEKEVVKTVVVEKEKAVEKVVKETVVVEKPVTVEKVVKETVVQEKVITPTPVKAKYKEAPMLAGLVAQGKLPPVDERLPEEPMVIKPWEEIGQYGGTWHRLATSVSDTQLDSKMVYEWLVRYDKDGATLIPNVAKSWEASPDGKVFTFHLRKGMKWSDGQPFSADDLVFMYEDIWLVKELGSVPGEYKAGGKPVVIQKADDFTVRFVFEAPYGTFLAVLGGIRGINVTRYPKHYLSQFHIKYADKAKLEAATKEAGFEFWYQLFGNRSDPRSNMEMPVISAWHLVTPSTKQPLVAERNPYYWKVDTAGNQLPYIDRIEFMLVESAAQVNLRAMQGEVDMQERHITIDNYPLYQENKAKGDYRVLLWVRGQHDIVLGLNHSHKDPVLRAIIGDKRFRYALSLGINRQEIIESAFLGLTEPSQIAPLRTSPLYWEPQAKNLIEYDPARANQLLDEMGLTKRDAEGYRLRPDGKRLSLVYEYAPVFGAWGPIGELLAAHWKALGIELIVKEEARQLFEQRGQAGELDLGVWTGSGEFNPLIEPRSFVPVNTQPYHLAQYARWWTSGGKEGEEPTGDIRKVLELWEQVKMSVKEEDQIKLFRQILELNKENLWLIGICTPAPSPVIVKNNFRNVPETALYDDNVRVPGNTATEQYFIKS